MSFETIEMDYPPAVEELVDIWRKDGVLDLHYDNGKWRLIRQKPKGYKPTFHFEAHLIADSVRVAGLTLPRPKKHEKQAASAMLALMRAVLALNPGNREQVVWLARAIGDVAAMMYGTEFWVQSGASEDGNPISWIIIIPD